MNAKKAKMLRKLAKQDGKFHKDPQYTILHKVQKRIYRKNEFGDTKIENVTRVTLQNTSKTHYRNLKKMYKNGEFDVEVKNV